MTTPSDYAPFALLIAIAFFVFGRRYERWSHARYCEAMRRIRAKHQAWISNPSRTSKD